MLQFANSELHFSIIMSANKKTKGDVEMETEKNANSQIQPSDLQTNDREYHNNMFKHFLAGDFCDVTLEAGKDKRK